MVLDGSGTSQSDLISCGHSRTTFSTANSHTAEVQDSRITCAASSSRGIKTVHFDTVEIREYSRQAGDHPSCSNGPPIR
jgi:hypothetical protein